MGDARTARPPDFRAVHRGPQAPAFDPKLPSLFVGGDSTANNNANGGLVWGPPFATYFDASKINVVNRARRQEQPEPG